MFVKEKNTVWFLITAITLLISLNPTGDILKIAFVLFILNFAYVVLWKKKEIAKLKKKRDDTLDAYNKIIKHIHVNVPMCVHDFIKNDDILVSYIIEFDKKYRYVDNGAFI